MLDCSRTHMWTPSNFKEPGTRPRSAHMYLFMGKKKFPEFCLCNLSFNNQALCRNKSFIFRGRNLRQVYFLKEDESKHQRFGL